MYHSVLPPHMIMQIVNGQQVNGPCLSAQNTHSATVNGGNNSRQGECSTPYLVNGSGQNRQRLIQVSFPAKILNIRFKVTNLFLESIKLTTLLLFPKICLIK